MTSGVYQISITQFGKKYIGSTADIETRRSNHISRLRNGNHHNPHLQAAFQKYGEAEYSFQVLLICDPINLIMYEQNVIDSQTPEKLYNIRVAAEINLGIKYPPGTGAKISAANMGRKNSLESIERGRLARIGQKATPEARANMSAARIGYKASDESRANMSAAQKLLVTDETRARSSAVNKGRKHTPESIANMSAAHRNPSIETRARMSEAAKNKPSVSDETRKRIGDSHRGKPQSPEARAHSSAARMGFKPSDETRKKMSESGKRRPPISEVTREKLKNRFKKRALAQVQSEVL